MGCMTNILDIPELVSVAMITTPARRMVVVGPQRDAIQRMAGYSLNNRRDQRGLMYAETLTDYDNCTKFRDACEVLAQSMVSDMALTLEALISVDLTPLINFPIEVARERGMTDKEHEFIMLAWEYLLRNGEVFVEEGSVSPFGYQAELFHLLDCGVDGDASMPYESIYWGRNRDRVTKYSAGVPFDADLTCNCGQEKNLHVVAPDGLTFDEINRLCLMLRYYNP